MALLATIIDGMPVNAQWHTDHPMPQRPTFEERAAWHLAHHEACACRPIPPTLAADMRERGLLPT